MATSQLIDAQGSFIGTLPPTDSPTSRDYRIVAVVGCQSGGKSTLLNHAFATSFPVLDAPKRGRRRTTLGIWGALSNPHSSPKPLVVLDVEGTDSRERGEGAKAFESRTTLFTLALSDCVLVNMWAHDIGRYSAANYDLFETVFAHAIALRRSPDSQLKRTVSVLIVIRDHDGESAVSDIRRVLMGDLVNIWESLRVKDLAFQDVFHIDVITLPHKVYAPGAFETEVRGLSRRVAAEVDRRTEAQPVPLEAFDALARSVWQSVCDATGDAQDGALPHSAAFSLDLPRQATLAAHFRCGEAVTALWQGDLGQRVEALRGDIETNWQKPVANYASRIDELVDDAFAEYDKSVSAYREGGVAAEAAVKRREELGVQLAAKVGELRERHLSVCYDYCMNGFDDKFRPLLGGTQGFERSSRRLAKTYVSQYRSLVETASVPSVLKQYLEAKNEQDGNIDGGDGDGNADEGDGNADEGDAFETSFSLVEEHDALDVRLGLVDSDADEDEDVYSVERFSRDVMGKVEERKRMGELMLPGANGGFTAGGVKREPWWKGLLIRGVILLINYLQATQGQRAALKWHRQHEKEFPPEPSF